MIQPMEAIEAFPNATDESRAKSRRVIIAHDPNPQDLLAMLGLEQND
jgi:hypothetical protein